MSSVKFGRKDVVEMRFGCHVSIKEGYVGAAKLANSLGADTFQYFPKNPRALTLKHVNTNDAASCKLFCEKNDLISVAHTSYLTSLTPSESQRELTVQSLVNDLEIAEACGSIGVVVHFGSEISKKEPLLSYQLMIHILNEVLEKWNGQCKLLLENNAGKPGFIGTTIEELVKVRKLAEYSDKIGFCLDTCHAFASGLWTGENTKEFISKGKELDYFEHLHVVHLNNSKFPAKQGIDQHANIFKNGHIQEDWFEQLLTNSVFTNVPFILETPSEMEKKEEIKQLKIKWANTFIQ